MPACLPEVSRAAPPPLLLPLLLLLLLLLLLPLAAASSAEEGSKGAHSSTLGLLSLLPHNSVAEAA
jgi:hypothetical protein